MSILTTTTGQLDLYESIGLQIEAIRSQLCRCEPIASLWGTATYKSGTVQRHYLIAFYLVDIGPKTVEDWWVTMRKVRGAGEDYRAVPNREYIDEPELINAIVERMLEKGITNFKIYNNVNPN